MFLIRLKDNLFSYVFSLLLGGIITTLLFFFTSNPVTPEAVKDELLNISLDEIRERYGEVETNENDLVTIDKLLSSELDIGADKSIILVGSIKISDKLYRWISIFERKPPGLFDKLVGRSGFFELTSFTSYEAPYFNSLLIDKVEVVDFDGNGTSEIHIRVKSIWADSTSLGPLILTKEKESKWHLTSLPLMSSAINSPLKNPKMGGRRPYNFFGMVDDDNPELKSINELKKLSISEELWMLNHNREEKSFTTLRNGGDYIFRKHPVKGYSQIQTLSFLVDGEAVLAPHYAVVSVFKLGSGDISLDEL